jgi:hypothetical protein
MAPKTPNAPQVVERLYYDGGDDAVALKSGLGAEGKVSAALFAIAAVVRDRCSGVPLSGRGARLALPLATVTVVRQQRCGPAVRR